MNNNLKIKLLAATLRLEKLLNAQFILNCDPRSTGNEYSDEIKKIIDEKTALEQQIHNHSLNLTSRPEDSLESS